MIKIVFIGNDQKSLSIIKMSISNIKISLISPEPGVVTFIETTLPDIIIFDLEMDYKDSMTLLHRIFNISNINILVTGKSPKIKTIIEIIKMGALDYIEKPLTPENISHLELAIRECISSRLKKIVLKPEIYPDPVYSIVGESRKIQDIRDLVFMYAQSDAPVLILGESGVGKNLIAETIHLLSKRKNFKYKAVHTAGIPPTLIESELYGTESGAFTDAKQRPGYFEIATGGTLFLDEIGEIPPVSQVKLLRILEEKSITRLGGTRTIPIDVRIISATNINISNAVKKKEFREDLYYRINTLTIEIPPLKERVEDIPILIDYFLKTKTVRYSLTPAGLEKLINHKWPGNIRELQNTLTRACVHAGKNGEISDCHIIFM